MASSNVHSTQALQHMPIVVGTELLVEAAEMNLRMKSSLVGIDSGRYLIVKLPSHELTEGVDGGKLKESSLVIRYLYNGAVYGFKTNALNIVTDPAHLMIVSFPSKIEEHNARTSDRFDCILPARGRVDEITATMVILDISKTGCRCLIKTAEMINRDDLYAKLNIDAKVELLAQLPGLAEELKLMCTVRNVNKDKDKVVVGLRFEKMGEEAKERFGKFLMLISSVMRAT